MPQKKPKTASSTKRKSKAARRVSPGPFEKQLNKMRKDILNLVHHKTETELTEQEVGDEADAASQSAERELLFELSDNERQSLDAVEAALRKIELGNYGVCEACEENIPAKRLLAMPQARYCIKCQARFERPS